MTNSGPPPGGSWGQDPTGQNPQGQPGYGQAPQYGQPPPAYGNPPQSPPPGYGPPAAPVYGQAPQYGQPVPPVYGQTPQYGQPAPAGYGPPPPKKSNSAALILAAVAVVVIVVGVVLAITLTRDSGSDNPQGGGTSQSADPVTPSPTKPTNRTTPPRTSTSTTTSNTTGAAGTVSVADARKVADQYFQDIAAQNPAHAKTLLCKSAAAQFDDTLAQPQSDFDFTFTKVTYVSGTAASDETRVNYDVKGFLTKDPSTTVDVNLEFSVILEGGKAKLCGEQGTAN